MVAQSIQTKLDALSRRGYVRVDARLEDSFMKALQEQLQGQIISYIGSHDRDRFDKAVTKEKTVVIPVFDPASVEHLREAMEHPPLGCKIVFITPRMDDVIRAVTTFAHAHLYNTNLEGDRMFGLCKTRLEEHPPPEHALVMIVKHVYQYEAFKQFVLECFNTSYGPYVLEYMYDYVLLPITHRVSGSTKSRLFSVAMHIRMCAHAAEACHSSDPQRLESGQEMLRDMQESSEWYTFRWNKVNDVLLHNIYQMSLI